MIVQTTEPRDERSVLGWPALTSLAAIGVLMAALFLAHGLQCAATLAHGPSPTSSAILAPAIADDVMHHGTAPDRPEPTVLTASAADPVLSLGGRHMLVRAGVVCVAVLIGAGVWLLGRHARLNSGSANSWPSGRTCRQLLAVARWRLMAPDLAVLCVLRT